MKGNTVAILVSMLAVSAGLSGRAFAGEDSTDRWHGVGPAFYEVKGGLIPFAAGEAEAKRAPESREACR